MSPQAGELGDDADCSCTAASYKHVDKDHCEGKVPDKSQFISGSVVCKGMADCTAFCRSVQTGFNRRTKQSDGRICYDKDMGAIIGTKNQSWARLVMKVSGEVVTMFPETQAGCRGTNLFSPASGNLDIEEEPASDEAAAAGSE